MTFYPVTFIVDVLVMLCVTAIPDSTARAGLTGNDKGEHGHH
jgi:hypothetical protein